MSLMKRVCTQTIKVEFPKNVYTNSGDYTIHIPKLGDMITRIRITGNFGNNTIGESIIKETSFIVNSNIIETLKGEFIKLDNEMTTEIEKLSTLNTLVNGNFIIIDIPFYIVKKGFFIVSEPDLRISFDSTNTQLVDGYLLVDYALIENSPADTFFQRTRQVEDISVISYGCKSVKINTTFSNPVYQIYITVQNLRTGLYEEIIDTVSLYSGSTFERFSLPGKYLRYAEPLKRYKSIPSDPIYLYSFALDPKNIYEASGHMNFSRINFQRFDINFNTIIDPIKITIWAQSHNFCYFNYSNCSTVFHTQSYVSDYLENTLTSLPYQDLSIYTNFTNSEYSINAKSPNIIVSNVSLSNNITTDDVFINNMLLTSPGYQDVLANFYMKKVNPVFIQTDSHYNWPFIISILIDPQTSESLLLFTNATIYFQTYGALLLTNESNVFSADMIYDYNGDIITFYIKNDTNDLNVLKVDRNTKMINTLYTVNNPTSNTFNGIYGGCSAALFSDNFQNIFLTYFNRSTTSYILCDVLTGQNIASVNASFPYNNIVVNQFCNSSNNVIFNDLSFQNSLLVNFSNGSEIISNGYTTDTLVYYDGTNSLVGVNVNSMYLNGSNVLPVTTSDIVVSTNFNYFIGVCFTLDSFQNMWYFDGASGIYKFSLINSDFDNLNLLQLYYYTGSKSINASNYVDYIHFEPHYSVYIYQIYEDPSSHYINIVGVCNDDGNGVTVTDTDQNTIKIDIHQTFWITFDINGKFVFSPTIFNDLVKYKPKSSIIDFSANVFTNSLPPVVFPPVQLTSNIQTITNKVSGNGTYIISAINNPINAFKNFNGLPGYQTDYYDYITIGILGYQNYISNVFISDNQNNGALYLVRGSMDNSNWTDILVNVPSINNIITFPSVQTYTYYQILNSSFTNIKWIIYRISLLGNQQQIGNVLYSSYSEIVNTPNVNLTLNWTYSIYEPYDVLNIYYTQTPPNNWNLLTSTTCGLLTTTLDVTSLVSNIPYSFSFVVPQTLTKAGYNTSNLIYNSDIYISSAYVPITSISAGFSNINVNWNYFGYSSSIPLQIWYNSGAVWTLATTTTCGASPALISSLVPGKYNIALSVTQTDGGSNGPYNTSLSIFSTVNTAQILITSLYYYNSNITVNWYYIGYSPTDTFTISYYDTTWHDIPGVNISQLTYNIPTTNFIFGISYNIALSIPGGYNYDKSIYSTVNLPSITLTSSTSTTSSITVNWTQFGFTGSEYVTLNYYSHGSWFTVGQIYHVADGSGTIPDLTQSIISSSYPVAISVPQYYNQNYTSNTNIFLASVIYSSNTVTSTSATISWSYYVFAGNQSMQVLYKYTNSDSWTVAGTTTCGASPYTITGITETNPNINVTFNVSSSPYGSFNTSNTSYVSIQMANVTITSLQKSSPYDTIIVNWSYYAFTSSQALQVWYQFGSTWTLATTTTCGASTYTITGLTPGNTYNVALVIAGSYNTSKAIYQTIILSNTSLYTFSTFTFTNAGATGPYGPTSLSSYGTTYPGYNTAYALTIFNGIQYWTVPATGIYTVKVAGAGSFSAGTLNYINTGKGAVLISNINWTQGSIVAILVGQMGLSGGNSYGLANTVIGGSGGSFLANVTAIGSLTGQYPLIIAGGAGGPGYESSDSANTTINASIGNTGQNGGPYGAPSYQTGYGGTGPNAGTNPTLQAYAWADAGAGYSQNSPTGSAHAFINGGAGGTVVSGGDGTSAFGGFGGGGCGGNYGGVGGGGGGWGGGGSGGSDGQGAGGGGGGSYFDSNLTLTSGGSTNTGMGYITIIKN